MFTREREPAKSPPTAARPLLIVLMMVVLAGATILAISQLRHVTTRSDALSDQRNGSASSNNALAQPTAPPGGLTPTVPGLSAHAPSVPQTPTVAATPRPIQNSPTPVSAAGAPPAALPSLTEHQRQALETLAAAVNQNADLPSAAADLNGFPKPRQVSGLISDNSHAFTFNSTTSVRELVSWYGSELKAARYSFSMLDLPEDAPVQAIQFTTSSGHHGSLMIATVDDSSPVESIVQVTIQ
jgi:hypothetical protein